MDVTFDTQQINEREIAALVRTTGMYAIPWHERKRGGKEPFLLVYGRLILTVLSGSFLIAGAFFQYLYPFHYLSQALYLLSVLCGIWYVLPKALFSLHRFSPDMNLLMVIAIGGAIIIQQWFEGATVAFLFSFSLLLEQWSVGRARKAISALMELSPTQARVIDPLSQKFEERGVDSVEVGSRILVRPGEKVPMDGIVESGSSSIDQSPITGESLPVFKEEGDEVFAGTLNADGALTCRVTKAADEGTLARIIRLVEEARSKRSESEQWVETFARYYTPIMLFFSILVMVIPPFVLGGSWSDWIYRGLVLLVIACPCALVISTPVSIVCGLTAAARAGVLIKGGNLSRRGWQA